MYELSKPKLLCIDDDPAVTTAISTRLSQFEIDVQTAFFGEQGVWLAVTELPQVIITDMRMPNGGGDFVVECLKSRTDTCHIPVIVLTGVQDDEMQRWMLTLGVEHYLYKPICMRKLLSTLEMYVDLPCRKG